MAYCTQSQLEDRFGNRFLVELSDREEVASNTIDADLFTRAIADADAMIDGYLAPVYALPLAQVPNLINTLSINISIYMAHGDIVSDKITRDYDNALKQLKDISNGLIKLDVAGVEPEGSGSSEVITNDQEQVMNSDNMKGFI